MIRKLIQSLEIDLNEVRVANNKDLDDWNKWLAEPVPMELVLKPNVRIYLGAKIPDEIDNEEKALEYVASMGKEYEVGLWGGQPIVLKAGRYLFSNHEHLGWTERWFAKNGSWTILVGRFIPVVRHLISIPAGLGRMNVWRFSIFTLVGATIWNTFLLYCGYKLRQNWTLVQQYSHELDIVVGVLGVAALGIWLGVRRFRKKQSIAVKKVR